MLTRGALATLLLAAGAAVAGAQVTATATSSNEADAVRDKAEALIKAGRPAEAEAAYREFFARNPRSLRACTRVAEVLLRPLWSQRSRFDEGMTVLEGCLPLDDSGSPADGHQALAQLFWDKAYRDGTLTDAQKDGYADKGLAHVDRALQAKPNLIDALVYKGLLLRMKAMVATNAGRRAALLDEARQLQSQALALRQSGKGEFSELSRYVALVPPPPPPPPPPRPAPGAVRGVEGGVAGGVEGRVVGGLPAAPPPPQAVRVGGQIKEPRKVQDAQPVYPDIAKQARVQGIVIMECTINPQGKVTEVKVLRGIPLLDAAAVEAVRQWEYTPTLVNGVPVAVIMTVTVNFTLK